MRIQMLNAALAPGGTYTGRYGADVIAKGYHLFYHVTNTSARIPLQYQRSFQQPNSNNFRHGFLFARMVLSIGHPKLTLCLSLKMEAL